MNFDQLKAEALASPKKRSRLILEPGFDMVICLHRDSYIRCHRHPKFEAYHLIEGELGVLWDDPEDITILTPERPFLSITAGRWHEPVANSEFVIYREFYCGPFEKARDVEYAPWAKEEAA